MRIKWRRPRFSSIYGLFGVVICVYIIITFFTRNEDRVEEEVRAPPPPQSNGVLPLNPDNNLKEILPPLEEKHQDDLYTGPFPDSKCPEGDQGRKIDYHNYIEIKNDLKRTGLGEQGRAAKVPPGNEKREKELYLANGFNGLLSEYIALDRALPDIRHSKCKDFTYFPQLPTVSVVIPFFEEQWSALLRTVVSVKNRTPKQLLKEIILVDDGSYTRDYLGEPLDKWLAEHVPVARVLRLKERQGLITARQTGAKEAVGDVIVVLDSHCEVMVNWLPPLLHPIALDHRTAVCPLIDVITWDDFTYHPQDNGARGGFDWNFFYKRIPLEDKWEKNLPEPFPNPVMNGGLFAISRKFFWELGGYDPGLLIWGGEQYDLSFKIWQCGGQMLDAPCSRVGHVFRGTETNRPAAKQGNMTPRNYKRVAMVWMDEYMEAIYEKNPSLRKLDAGDVTGELAIREKLQCKPFKWFIDTVAPDIFKVYPPFEPADFANGTIKHVKSGLCMDNGGKRSGTLITYSCHGAGNQVFHWCWREFIRIPDEQFCLEAPTGGGNSPILFNCHNLESMPKQKWKYNPNTRQIVSSYQGKCLAVGDSYNIIVENCVQNDSNQQWEFSKINYQRIKEVFKEFS